MHDPNVGIKRTAPTKERSVVDAQAAFNSLVERLAAVDQSGRGAAGLCRRDDLIFEVHPEIGELAPYRAMRLHPNAGLVVPAQLRIQIERLPASGYGVFHTRRSESAMHSSEQRNRRRRLECHANAGNRFSDAITGAPVQVGSDAGNDASKDMALIIVVLQAHTRRKREALCEEKAVLKKSGESVAVAVFIVTQRAGARAEGATLELLVVHPFADVPDTCVQRVANSAGGML